MATKRSTILKVDEPSFSGMTYPRPLIQAIVDEFATGTMPLYGCRHGVNEHGGVVKLSCVSHAVTKLELVGNELIAEIATLDTPDGRRLATLLEDGSTGSDFRATGFGSVGNALVDSQLQTYVKEYRLESVDYVFVGDEDERTES